MKERKIKMILITFDVTSDRNIGMESIFYTKKKDLIYCI